MGFVFMSMSKKEISFLEAVFKGDLEIVKSLISTGKVKITGSMALLHAASHGHIKMVRWLLKNTKASLTEPCIFFLLLYGVKLTNMKETKELNKLTTLLAILESIKDSVPVARRVEIKAELIELLLSCFLKNNNNDLDPFFKKVSTITGSINSKKYGVPRLKSCCSVNIYSQRRNGKNFDKKTDSIKTLSPLIAIQARRIGLVLKGTSPLSIPKPLRALQEKYKRVIIPGTGSLNKYSQVKKLVVNLIVEDYSYHRNFDPLERLIIAVIQVSEERKMNPKDVVKMLFGKNFKEQTKGICINFFLSKETKEIYLNPAFYLQCKTAFDTLLNVNDSEESVLKGLKDLSSNSNQSFSMTP